MPNGRKAQKRPADVIVNAVKAMPTPMGEEANAFPVDDGKDKAAQLWDNAAVRRGRKH